MSNQTAPALDAFHAHEALDRCSMLTGMVDEYLRQHPYIEQHADLRLQVEQVIQSLYKVYQNIGKLNP